MTDTDERRKEFNNWLAKVDRALEAMCGLSHMGLADCDYWNMFECGTSPVEAAKEVLEENGFPQE